MPNEMDLDSNNITVNNTIYIIIASILIIIVTPSIIQCLLYPALLKQNEEILELSQSSNNDVMITGASVSGDTKFRYDTNEGVNNNTDTASPEIKSPSTEELVKSSKPKKDHQVITTSNTSKTESIDSYTTSNTKEQLKQEVVKEDENNDGNKIELNIDKEDDDEDKIKSEQQKQDNNNWRCVCETGFLPPGLLKNFGGAEAMIRLGTGSCYHKK